MVRFSILSLIATAAVIPTYAARLPGAIYRISCDSPRPPQGAPGRHFLAINRPSANATFSRYLTEPRAPKWLVKPVVDSIYYRIESESFKDVRLAYPIAQGGVQVRGDGDSDNLELFDQWTIVDAQPTGTQAGTYLSFVRPYNSGDMFLDCNHGLTSTIDNSSPAYLRPDTTQNSVIQLHFEKMGDLPKED
ncbi:hypothetical protein B0J17DRAFT_772186 [Rhizoctonia solani]|nr:hypothetical protein B0J17DRAFT_772186 [Rhizoctonia solani]